MHCRRTISGVDFPLEHCAQVLPEVVWRPGKSIGKRREFSIGQSKGRTLIIYCLQEVNILQKGRIVAIKKIIAMALCAMIALSLFGCYSGGSISSQTGSSEEVAGTPSLRERGKTLTDKEVGAERKAMAFDDCHRKWISDEDYMRQWLNSGQQYEEWCIAMDDFIYEIKSFPSRTFLRTAKRSTTSFWRA